MSLFKQRLSIPRIGRNRFYLGITSGLLVSVVLFLFLAYLTESFRALTLHNDLLIPTEREFFLFNLFFAAVSVTVGFGVSVLFWFTGSLRRQTPAQRVYFIWTNAAFWSMILLFLLGRVGMSLFFVLYTTPGYDDHLNLVRDFYVMLFMLPVMCFLNIWMPVRLVYRSGSWFLKAFIAFVSLAAILALTTPIDQGVLNDAWLSYMSPYNKIVDDEIALAHSKGILISEKAIETVRFNRKERVLLLATNLKNRFSQDAPVPTDSIVLELILIRKNTIPYLPGTNAHEQWPFALPQDVVRQIQLSDDTVRNGYLTQIIETYQSYTDPQTEILIFERGDFRSVRLARHYREMIFEDSLNKQ